MPTLTLHSPAKLNLMLAITGRRDDGFHELVSVVAPLAWGDTLTTEVPATATGSPAKDFSLTCDDPAVPVDATNLVLRAAQAFRAATGWKNPAVFSLQKRIPMGAGLGGGSSNAAAALRALNHLAGQPLSRDELAVVAAKVGSDCALFLHDGPVVMRGRGERVEPLPAAAAASLRGRSVLVFKPAFAISTAWAYEQLAAAAPAGYAAPVEAEARLARWLELDRAEAAWSSNAARPPVAGGEASPPRMDELLFNNMEAAAFAKFPALPLLLERLRRDFGLAAGMSGSGSACFAFMPDHAPVAVIEATIRGSWGESTVVVRTGFA